LLDKTFIVLEGCASSFLDVSVCYIFFSVHALFNFILAIFIFFYFDQHTRALIFSQIVLRAPMTPFSFLPVPTPPTESADPAEVAPRANTRSRDVLPEARGPRAPPAARAPPDTRWMSLVYLRGIPNVCSVGNLARLVQLRYVDDGVKEDREGGGRVGRGAEEAEGGKTDRFL